MHAIFRRFATAAIIPLVVAAAACSDQTVTGAAGAPSNAQFDGGATFGSGNNFGVATGGVENTTAADSGSTARGGATFGSGN